MRIIHSISLVAVMVTAVSVSAHAQGSGTRGGFLFGGTTRGPVRNNFTILVDMSASSISDSDLTGQPSVGSADFLVRGLTSQLTTTADYSRARRRTFLEATGGTTYQYLSSLQRVSPVSHNANVGWSLRLPRHSILRLSSGAAFSPSYLYELFPTPASSDTTETVSPEIVPGEVVPANPDFRVHQVDSYTFGGKASLAVATPHRSHVMGSVEGSRTQFDPHFYAEPNLTVTAANVQFNQPISSAAGWSIDYEHSNAIFGAAGRTIEDRMSVAGEYSRSLTRTRRATFRLAVGPGMLRVPASSVFSLLPSLAPPPDGFDARQTLRLYQIEIDAAAAADLGRRLRGSVNYHRGIEYLALLTQPVLADAIRFETTGVLTRRVDWSAGAGYATGASALNSLMEPLKTKTAELKMRYAVSRSLAAYAEYLHYSYDFHDQFQLAPDVPHAFHRNEIRFGGMLIVRPIHTVSRRRR